MYPTSKTARRFAVGGIIAAAAACSADPLSQPAGPLAPATAARQATPEMQPRTNCLRRFARRQLAITTSTPQLPTDTPKAARARRCPARELEFTIAKRRCSTRSSIRHSPNCSSTSRGRTAVSSSSRLRSWFRPQPGTPPTPLRRCSAIRSSRTSVFPIGAVHLSRTTSCTCGFGSTIRTACTRPRIRTLAATRRREHLGGGARSGRESIAESRPPL